MKKELRITVNSDGKFEVKINDLSGAELIMAINELIISVKKVNDNEAISDIENIDSELELMSLTISAVATSIVVAKKEGYTDYAKKLAKVINHMVDNSLFDFIKEV